MSDDAVSAHCIMEVIRDYIGSNPKLHKQLVINYLVSETGSFHGEYGWYILTFFSIFLIYFLKIGELQKGNVLMKSQHRNRKQ